MCEDMFVGVGGATGACGVVIGKGAVAEGIIGGEVIANKAPGASCV